MRGEGVEPSQAHRSTAPQTVASAIPPSSRKYYINPVIVLDGRRFVNGKNNNLRLGMRGANKILS